MGKEAQEAAVKKEEDAEKAKDAADAEDFVATEGTALANVVNTADNDLAQLARDEAAKEAEKLIQTAREATTKAIQMHEADVTSKEVKDTMVKDAKNEQERQGK